MLAVHIPACSKKHFLIPAWCNAHTSSSPAQSFPKQLFPEAAFSSQPSDEEAGF